MPTGDANQQLVLYGIIVVLFVIATGAVILLIRNILTNRKNNPQQGSSSGNQPAKGLFGIGQKNQQQPKKPITESSKPDGSGAMPSSAAVIVPPSGATSQKKQEAFGMNPLQDRSKEKFDVSEIVTPDKKPISAESINTDFPYSSLTPKSYVSPEDKAAEAAKKEEKPVEQPKESPATDTKPVMPPGAIPMPQTSPSVQVAQPPIVLSAGAMMPGPIEIPVEDETVPTVSQAPMPVPNFTMPAKETLPERAPEVKVSSASKAPPFIQEIMTPTEVATPPVPPTTPAPVPPVEIKKEPLEKPVEVAPSTSAENTETNSFLPPLPAKGAALDKPDFSKLDINSFTAVPQTVEKVEPPKPEPVAVKPVILPEIPGVPELHKAAPVTEQAQTPAPVLEIEKPPEKKPNEPEEAPILTQEAFAEKPKSSFDPLSHGIEIGMMPSAPTESSPTVAPTVPVQAPQMPPSVNPAPTVQPQVIPPVTLQPQVTQPVIPPVPAPEVVPQVQQAPTPQPLPTPVQTGERKFNPLDTLLP